MALIKLDSAPINYLPDDRFASEFKRWLTNLIDSIATAFEGIRNGTTAEWVGGGLSHAFVVAGVKASDNVVGTILTSTNNVTINKIGSFLFHHIFHDIQTYRFHLLSLYKEVKLVYFIRQYVSIRFGKLEVSLMI